MSWVTVSEARLLADIPETVTDERLSLLLTSACEWIENHCERKFAQDTYTETFQSFGQYVYLHNTPIEDVLSVSVKTHDGLDFHVIFFLLNSDIGLLRIIPTPPSSSIITVVYVGGYSVIPVQLKQAASELAKHFATHPAGVSQMSVGAASATVQDIPERIMQLIGYYKKRMV